MIKNMKMRKYSVPIRYIVIKKIWDLFHLNWVILYLMIRDLNCLWVIYQRNFQWLTICEFIQFEQFIDIWLNGIIYNFNESKYSHKSDNLWHEIVPEAFIIYNGEITRDRTDKLRDYDGDKFIGISRRMCYGSSSKYEINIAYRNDSKR